MSEDVVQALLDVLRKKVKACHDLGGRGLAWTTQPHQRPGSTTAKCQPHFSLVASSYASAAYGCQRACSMPVATSVGGLGAIQKANMVHEKLWAWRLFRSARSPVNVTGRIRQTSYIEDGFQHRIP